MCIFCTINKSEFIKDYDNFFLLWDIDPIQEGHILIVSKRHLMSYDLLTHGEIIELAEIQNELIRINKKLNSEADISIIINNGSVMDKGVHFHVHVIPRYIDDEFWDHNKVNTQRYNKSQFLKYIVE